MPVRRLLVPLAASLVLFSPLGFAAKKLDLDYLVRFVPEKGVAEVEMAFENGEAVHSVLVSRREARYSDFKADGQWEDGDQQNLWTPAAGKARLRWTVQIDELRDNGTYEARMTPDWALFRGEDLQPTMELSLANGVELATRLTFELPKGWTGAETGWPRVGKNKFRIDDPERLFDRPSGWMLVGKIGSRRARLGDTDVTVAAPVGEGMRRMDVLTMLTFVWPEAQNVFPRDPKKLLVVGADDPMWRGGLSGPNSMFMHVDRPLVSENGTSSLIHELVHVFSRIRDEDRSDWITEGLAEYYAIELMRRAGGMTEDRYQLVRKQLKNWSKDVTSLRTDAASGPVTARAVLFLQVLDRDIRKASQGRHSLDDLARGLMRMDRVTTEDFIEISDVLLGGSGSVRDSSLLR